jgi:hypothetical protein
MLPGKMGTHFAQTHWTPSERNSKLMVVKFK